MVQRKLVSIIDPAPPLIPARRLTKPQVLLLDKALIAPIGLRLLRADTRPDAITVLAQIERFSKEFAGPQTEAEKASAKASIHRIAPGLEGWPELITWLKQLKQETHLAPPPVRQRTRTLSANALGSTANRSPNTQLINDRMTVKFPGNGTSTRTLETSSGNPFPTQTSVGFSFRTKGIPQPVREKGKFGYVKVGQTEVCVPADQDLSSWGAVPIATPDELSQAGLRNFAIPDTHAIAKKVPLVTLKGTPSIEMKDGKQISVYSEADEWATLGAATSAPVWEPALQAVLNECKIGMAIQVPGVVKVLDYTSVYLGKLHDGDQHSFVRRANRSLEPFLGPKITLILSRAHGRPLQAKIAEMNLHDSPQYRADIIEKLQIFLKIAKIVSSMHDARFVHRDLQPKNIVVSDTGDVKLVDLGLAGVIGDKAPSTLVSPVSDIPSGGQPFSPADDVFQMGVLLLQLCTTRVALPGGGDIWTPWGNLHSQFDQLKFWGQEIPPANAMAKMRVKVGIDKASGKDIFRPARTQDFPKFWETAVNRYLVHACKGHIADQSGLTSETLANGIATLTLDMLNPLATERPKLSAIIGTIEFFLNRIGVPTT